MMMTPTLRYVRNKETGVLDLVLIIDYTEFVSTRSLQTCGKCRKKFWLDGTEMFLGCIVQDEDGNERRLQNLEIITQGCPYCEGKSAPKPIEEVTSPAAASYTILKYGNRIISVAFGGYQKIVLGQRVKTRRNPFISPGTTGVVVRIYEPYKDRDSSDIIEVLLQNGMRYRFKFKDLDISPSDVGKLHITGLR